MAENPVQRRLAAIAVADVVGYSRLMEADEAGTLAALKDRRKSILEPTLRSHGGRIVKVMGDGVLIEFASAVNAVKAALELQGKFAEANEALPDNRKIVLRIGINLGDVIGEGSDIYGDGVNIAARLEALAEPGGICISGKVQDEVRGKNDAIFEDAGEQQLKNIASPVRVYRHHPGVQPVVAPALALPDKPSIAILPFQNMSGDPEQEYFSDGITEDIITELSRFRTLFVIARNSSFVYKGKSINVATIARELKVEYVLEGSVRRAASRVRVTAQLIQARSGNHVWAERYNRDLADIFEMQDEIVGSIAARIEGRIAASVVDDARRKPTANMKAYECVLQARQNLGTYDVELAEPLLNKALALDPEYAQAHAWLAMVYLVKFFDDHKPETIALCVAKARDAVLLDDSDAICHAQLGFSYLFSRQFDMADIHSRRALEINPADMLALSLRAHWQCRAGQAGEAIVTLDEVLNRDPYPPSWYWENRAIALMTLRRFDEAITSIQRMGRILWWDRCYLGACHAHLGAMSHARAEVAQALDEWPRATISDLMKGEPFRKAEDAQSMIEGLREAGLPE